MAVQGIDDGRNTLTEKVLCLWIFVQVRHVCMEIDESRRQGFASQVNRGSALGCNTTRGAEADDTIAANKQVCGKCGGA